MDRQAFKQRMQNLKSYRENNPGKGYWDWKVETFADGGEVGDPEKERFYQATGRSSSGRPLEEGLKPVFSLEDAANMTPIGDAISAKDAYDAVKNRDWLGAGLAAVTMIPFVPTTVRNFRKKYKGITPKREIPNDNQKAGALSLPIFDNRFVDTKKTKTMYPKTYDWIQRYLHNFEETKSHMNEFRTNMINKNLLKPDSKVGLKQIKDLIFNSDNDNMKKLFNTYKSKRQFVKDFNSVPITSNGNNKTLV